MVRAGNKNAPLTRHRIDQQCCCLSRLQWLHCVLLTIEPVHSLHQTRETTWPLGESRGGAAAARGDCTRAAHGGSHMAATALPP